MEYKFPSKFAAMEISRFSDWCPGLNEIFAYVAVECYLISETKRYLPDGSSKTSYEVVFKWRENKDDEIFPNFRFGYKCFNSVIVDNVFDTYEAAKDYTEAINKEHIARNLDFSPIETYNERRKQKEAEINELYELFETKAKQPTKRLNR